MGEEEGRKERGKIHGKEKGLGRERRSKEGGRGGRGGTKEGRDERREGRREERKETKRWRKDSTGYSQWKIAVEKGMHSPKDIYSCFIIARQ